MPFINHRDYARLSSPPPCLHDLAVNGVLTVVQGSSASFMIRESSECDNLDGSTKPMQMYVADCIEERRR